MIKFNDVLDKIGMKELSDDLVVKINNAGQAAITKLNEHIKYYQNIVAQSKNLIDDLYDKNKIITAKLIKYKQICESNNITVGNSNASTFY